MPAATLSCFFDNRPISRPFAADLRGNVNGRFAFNGTHVRCRASAERYEAANRIVPVVNGRVDAGLFRLVRAPSVTLGPLSVTSMPQGERTVLETFMENETARRMDIRQIELTGSARLRTGCLDPRPAIIFEVRDRLSIGLVAPPDVPVGVHSPPTGWREQIVGAGRVTRLGCDQVRLQMLIPFLFSLNPGERQKLRIEIPNSVRQSSGRRRQLLDLARWEALRVSLVGADGLRSDTGLR